METQALDDSLHLLLESRSDLEMHIHRTSAVTHSRAFRSGESWVFYARRRSTIPAVLQRSFWALQPRSATKSSIGGRRCGVGVCDTLDSFTFTNSMKSINRTFGLVVAEDTMHKKRYLPYNRSRWKNVSKVSLTVPYCHFFDFPRHILLIPRTTSASLTTCP